SWRMNAMHADRPRGSKVISRERPTEVGMTTPSVHDEEGTTSAGVMGRAGAVRFEVATVSARAADEFGSVDMRMRSPSGGRRVAGAGSIIGSEAGSRQRRLR